MAMTGRFDANFETFYGAVQKAVVELKGFDAATGQVESSMNRMVDTFSGRKIVTEATIMTEAIEKIGGVAKLTAAELQKVGAVAAEAAEKYAVWGGEVPANIQKYADAAKAASSTTTDWGASLSAFNGVLGAFGASISIGAIVNFAKETAAAAEQLDKLHTRTGIGIEALERFQTVGDAAGNTLEQIAGAAVALSERLATGNKSTKGALEDLGISVEAFKRLSMADQLTTIAAALQNIPDPARQVAEAYDLMGQKGVAILPTLKSDIEGIGTATHVMSEQSVKDWAAIANAVKSTGSGMKAYAGEWALSLLNFLPPAAVGVELAKFLTSIGALKGEVRDMVNAIPTNNPWGALVTPEVPGDLKNIEIELGNTAAQIKTARLETEGWAKIFDEMHKTTFQLAMEHEKQWREESAKQLAGRNKEVVDGLNQTRSAFGAYFDFLDKETLDSTDYQIKKIWEKVDADKLAFKGTEEQAKAYYAAVDALADAQTVSIMNKAAAAEASKAAATDRAAAREIATIQRTGLETQAELNKMSAAANATFDSILKSASSTQYEIDKAATMASDAGYYARLNPNGIDASKSSPGGGLLASGGGAGYPDTPEGRLQSLAAQQARYPTIPINPTGLFAGVPTVQSAMYAGPASAGGSSFNQTINITQPLGTPAQIARAVGDAQVSTLQGQGVRLPYGT